jgi:hypothetical protein
MLSASVTPDIFLKMEKENEAVRYIVLDAKYSTDDYGDIHKDRFENLYKYKSGIVKCDDLEFDGVSKEWK